MAVMTSQQPQAAAALDPVAIKITPSHSEDHVNGTLAPNGHHPLPDAAIPSAPVSDGAINHKSTALDAIPSPDSGHLHNRDAFDSNSGISAPPEQPEPVIPAIQEAPQKDAAAEDVDMTDAALAPIAAAFEKKPVTTELVVEEISIDKPAESVPDEVKPSVIEEVDEVPTQDRPEPVVLPVDNATTELQATTAPAATEPAETPAALEPLPSLLDEPEPESKPVSEPELQTALPSAEVKDVIMADAQPQPEPPSSVDVAESTQDTTTTNPVGPSSADLGLHPASMSNLAIDASQEDATGVVTADTSMSDVPPSPTKIPRGRDEDEAMEEPAAKRVRTSASQEPIADVVNVAAPMSLHKPNGEPMSLADPALDSQPLSPWQSKQLRAVLAAVKKTKIGQNFRQPVVEMWPTLRGDYEQKVKEPMDIGTMEKKLRQDPSYPLYLTMADFKLDLRLIGDNAEKFNGPEHTVTQSARGLVDVVVQKMTPLPAVEPPKPEKKEPKAAATRHTEPRAASQASHAQQAPPPPPAPRRKSQAVAASPTDKVAESPAFAVPSGGTPIIRRDSTKNDNDRPKRPIHPPKSKDFGFEPKKKRKLSPEMRFCSEVLDELKKAKYQSFNGAFIEPVDPVALNIPTYFKTIKKPMDLSTMTERLHNGEYATSRDVAKDFDLIVKNCKTFNGESHTVTQQALQLESLFNQEMAKKDAWMNKHAPSPSASAGAARGDDKDETEDEDDASEPEPETAPDVDTTEINKSIESLKELVRKKQDSLNALINSANPDMDLVVMAQGMLIELQKRLVDERSKLAQLDKAPKKPTSAKSKAAGKKKGAAGAGSTRKSAGAAAAGGKRSAGGGKKSAKNRVMGAVEKEIISEGINDLDGHNLERAIDIIKKDTNQNENESGELELDIELLSNDALSKLYDLINKAMPQLRAEKEKAMAVSVTDAPAAPKQSKSSKPKKAKPMGKVEQEQRLNQLKELRAQIKRHDSGSQEPIPSTEDGADAGSPMGGNLSFDDHASDDESSEEE